jgi:hypothetical protein
MKSFTESPYYYDYYHHNHNQYIEISHIIRPIQGRKAISALNSIWLDEHIIKNRKLRHTNWTD